MNQAQSTCATGTAGEPQRLLGIIADLRRHCRWTAGLTHASLVEYLVEESYELLEAIETGQEDDELRGELADVLYQLVLHAEIASERGAFNFTDIAAHLSEKMIRRNTRIFHPDGSLRGTYPADMQEIIDSWDAAKHAEDPSRTGPFASLPLHLPALALADKAIGRARRWTGDTPAPEAPQAPQALKATEVADEEELGELLLGIVAAAHERGLDAERSLRTVVGHYMGRSQRTSPPAPGTG